VSDDLTDDGHDPATVDPPEFSPPAGETCEETGGADVLATSPPPDLDMIESDLADVEVALQRLDDGEYWRDEATGEPLDDAVLEQRPATRRNA
jgi:hypothetical protein